MYMIYIYHGNCFKCVWQLEEANNIAVASGHEDMTHLYLCMWQLEEANNIAVANGHKEGPFFLGEKVSRLFVLCMVWYR
jgi:hypothetical protein